MASRKRLRPVAAPVDPFVTPANPGPEQSNQTWDGLLQLSNSLMQADQAYRTAEEKKKREARAEKAEERRERAQAEADAGVGVTVLQQLDKNLVKRYQAGEATEEDNTTLIAAFTKAGIAEPNNPQLIQAIKREQVRLLPSNGVYENTMLDPEFLDSIQVLPEDQKQQAMQERKAEWLASQDVPESLRPVLLTELRGYDERVNSVLAARRLKQHEAQTNRIYTDAAGLATEAIVSLDDDKKAAAVQQIVSFHRSLSAADKTKSEKQLMGVMSERLKYEITSEDMKEDDVDDVISMLEENKLLPAEDIANLQNMAETALRVREQRAQDPVRSSQVDMYIAGILATAIAQQEIQNGGEPLTDEQLQNVVNGRYKDIEGIYRGAGLQIERTQTAINDAKRVYRGDREARRSDDRDLVVSLDTMVDQLNPDAIDNINQAYKDKKITRETRNRLLDEVERSTDPEQVSSRVSRFLQRQVVPAGIEAPNLQRDLEQAFLTTPGTIKEKSAALQNLYSTTLDSLLASQPEELRTDAADYWMAPERRPATRALLNDSVRSSVEKYYPENTEEGYRDIIQYMFDGLPAEEKARFRRASKSAQSVFISGYIGDLGTDRNREALENFLQNKQRKTEQAEESKKSRAMSADDRSLGKDVGAARVRINDAYVRARVDLGEQENWFKSMETYNAEANLDRFAEVVPGEDILQRTPRNWAEEYQRGLFGVGQVRARSRQYQSEAQYISALALMNQVSDGVKVSDFVQFTGVDSARKYLKAHFLNYGVPIKSMAAGKHLNVELGQDFTFNSSPYFASLEDLNNQVRKNDEGVWEVSDDVAKAFGVLGLNVEEEAIVNFYNAQAKLVPTTPELQELFRRQQTPDFEGWEHMITDGIWRTRSGARFSVDEFRSTVMGDK